MFPSIAAEAVLSAASLLAVAVHADLSAEIAVELSVNKTDSGLLQEKQTNSNKAKKYDLIFFISIVLFQYLGVSSLNIEDGVLLICFEHAKYICNPLGLKLQLPAG